MCDGMAWGCMCLCLVLSEVSFVVLFLSRQLPIKPTN